MLTRRGFIGRLAGAFAAALASPPLSVLARHTLGSFGEAPTLAFRPDAFDQQTGIGIRFIRNWDIGIVHVTRLDVIYGTGYVREPRGSFAAYLEADHLVQSRAAVVPCATCIQMVAASCRRRGRCMDEDYRNAVIDFSPGVDGWLS